MNKRSLIIGMGIGQLYKDVLTKLGHEIVTVDQDVSKNADFDSVDKALLVHGLFDTAHICTPNFTHFEIAAKVAPHSKIVFIEKPGVANSSTWQKLVETFTQTRFMMVKNNMWRDNIAEMKEYASKSTYISIQWCNKDRIPSPGSWFTNKELAFGGVSRDLMPHLLSLYIAMNPDWKNSQLLSKNKSQQWTLNELANTDYGTIDRNGIYNVDDMARLELSSSSTCPVEMLTEWRTLTHESRFIRFTLPNRELKIIELGLCPEYAYQSMIKDAVENINNAKFWLDQFAIDMWIHEQVENL